jgi:cation:H+ antiporter
MPELLTWWGLFAAAAAVIGFSGPHLSRNGDIIAEKTGLSGSWIGIILIATVTSLPELVTGGSAVAMWNLPDIAVGDVFGSCVFNMAILIVVDFMLRERPLYIRANVGHIVSAGFGVVLLAFAALSLMMAASGTAPSIGHVGVSSLVLVGLYAAGMRTVFIYEKNHREAFSEEVAERYPNVTLRMAATRYALAALAIVAAGVALPVAGAGIAEAMGWNRTFVGTMLVAAATSLPELVVTFFAVRYGALNMAVAGLLGSNLFNMMVLATEDVLYVKGPLMGAVSPAHAVSAMSAVIMTGLVIIGLQARPSSFIAGRVGWITIALFIVYVLNSYVMFLHGH